MLGSARLRSAALALTAAVAVVVLAHQVAPGHWYEPFGAYRAQVDAMLAGRLALSRAPEGMQHDVAWTASGTQQVWGLGVPLWQLPFEAFGRAIGWSPFPDRVALVAWLALVAYCAIRAWWRRSSDSWWSGAGAIAITALLPAFATLLRGRLGVYEEAALYAYGAAIILLAQLVRFADEPTRWRYLALCAAAGLGALIRPTVACWGGATALVATIVLWRAARVPVRARIATIALGGALFAAGGGVLYATNAARFGAGTEFGHHLNLQGLPGSLIATRFSHPFERVGVGEAALELGGALFDSPERRVRTTYYGHHLHHGQSSAPRWREYYFSVYSWAYAPLLLLGLAIGVAAWRRRATATANADADTDATSDVALERWLVAWAVIGLAPLLVYYLRSNGLTSRYFLDLGPGFAALLVIAWRWIASRGRWTLAALAALWLANVALSRVAAPHFDPVDAYTATVMRDDLSRVVGSPRTIPAAYELGDPWLPADTDVMARFVRCANARGHAIDPDAAPVPGDWCLQGEREGESEQWTLWSSVVGDRDDDDALADRAATTTCSLETTCPPSPTAASAGEPELLPVPPPALFLNMFRWDLDTGAVPPATFAWIQNPEFIELDLATRDRSDASIDWARVAQVAIGREHLHLVSIADTADGVRLRFEGAQLPRGIAVVFLMFGDDSAIDQVRTKFALYRLRWRSR